MASGRRRLEYMKRKAILIVVLTVSLALTGVLLAWAHGTDVVSAALTFGGAGLVLALVVNGVRGKKA
jgi:hypothetical protein